MSKAFLSRPKRVEMNGVDVAHILTFTIDDLSRKSYDVDTMDTHHTISIDQGQMGSGTIEMIGMGNLYANDPANIADLLAMTLGHGEYDTATGKISIVEDDITEKTPGNASCNRIVELRQVEATAAHAISDSGATDEGWAQSFPAAGENLYLVKLKAYDSAGTKVETFDLEIWTDSADKPNTKLAGTNTITVYATSGANTTTTYYLGHTLTSGTAYTDAVWETVEFAPLATTDIMGTASLTVGTTYWLVVRNVTSANDDLFLAYTTNARYEGGVALQEDDLGTSGWDDAPAGTEDLTFVFQFYTEDGLQLDFYDYDASGVNGIKYSFKKVKVMTETGTTATPKQVTTGRLKWSSDQVTISTF